MSRHQTINPADWGLPKGYSNGILAAPGRLLFVAGQVGWNKEEKFESEVFADQFEQALANVMAVVEAAGGKAEDICRFTMYIVDKKKYLADLKSVGQAYRKHMGKNFPVMAMVEVSQLIEDQAQVEIEATAVIPEER